MGNLNSSNSLDKSSLTLFEKQLNTFRETQCEVAGDNRLLDRIKHRMQESTLGSFLYHLNKRQLQEVHVQEDKLARVRFDIERNVFNSKTIERCNDICDDLLELIENSLKNNPSGKITVRSTLKRLQFLRLTGSRVAVMDSSLRNLTNLNALVLAGNCLPDFPGSSLPRSLLLLELCCNSLQDLSLLLLDPPPHLLYLGLAWNYLTHDVIAPLRFAPHLYQLDLAHNDIEDLAVLTTTCSELVNLSSLLLLGNPCSLVASYAELIVSSLPNLIFLDGEMLKKPTADQTSKDDYDCSGTLQIVLYRIMSLSQPPTQRINKKKVIHTFRIEVDCSPLKSCVPEREESFIKEKSLKQDTLNKTTPVKIEKQKPKKEEKKKTKDINTEKNGDALKRKIDKTNNSTKKEKKMSKKKDLKEPNYEDLKESALYETMLKEDIPQSEVCFVSERKNWAKIIQFDKPTIEVSNCDLTQLRNVFRSNMCIRVVHIKTLPPAVKKNKTKPKKQGKIKTMSEGDESTNKETNKEILVSITTIAKIKVPLQPILWNVEFLDYSWVKTKPLKVDLSPGLKPRIKKEKRTKIQQSCKSLQT